MEEIRSQIAGAFLSGDKMKDGTTKTGIRDATTSAILECVVTLGKTLRKRTAGVAHIGEVEVRRKLEEELEAALNGTHIEDHINPLLGMPGEL